MGEETTPDEVKTYHEEVGDQEDAPCERSANTVDLRDVKLGLVNEREQQRENERSRHDRMADFSSYQNAYTRAAQGFYGSFHNAGSPFSPYPHHLGLSPFGGGYHPLPMGSPQMGGMHLPEGRRVVSVVFDGRLRESAPKVAFDRALGQERRLRSDVT
ncbi:hypothetical protein BV898_08752 [Hypsibius exemplaris]|uniref:CTNNB1 binding N-teminal domain-containing protein n=1 Tax=Hypsibius exemplaris TaxID=2072580 RepID=A0A1W0WPP8_HYPEX|nr:hypothetical protein BV898_08752 [Hypsibius exemplaris]